MKKLICLLLSLLLLCGCGVRRDGPVDEAIKNENTSEPAFTVYFPDDGTITYSHPIDPEETVFLGELIKTNTTEITVKNTGSDPFTCYLYYPDRAEESIQTFTLEPGKKMAFSGLTSRYIYGISFQAEESGTISAEIHG